MAHALQCLQDGRACCPVVPKQLVICRSCGFTGAVTLLLFQLVVALDWYGMVCNFRSMKLVPTSTRTWWWCVSMYGARFAVFARPARVLSSPSQATGNLSFLEVSATPSRCCFKSLFMCTGTGWIEIPTEWKPCKRVRARTCVS